MGRPRVWTVFVAYFVVLAAMLGAGIAAVVAALVVLTTRGASVSEAVDALNEVVHSRAGILGGVVLSSVCLLGVGVCGALVSPVSFARRLRLGSTRLPVLWQILVVVACLAASWAFGEIPRLIDENDSALARLAESQRNPTAASLILSLVVAAGLAPVAEELFFRGYLQTRLEERWSRWPAIGITAALFGAFHMSVAHGVFAALFGVCLGWVASTTGSIRLSIAAHAANNALFSLMLGLGIEHESNLVRHASTVAAAIVALGCGTLVVRRLSTSR
jgi:membrane protease YdiL (CAAX protease family)